MSVSGIFIVVIGSINAITSGALIRSFFKERKEAAKRTRISLLSYSTACLVACLLCIALTVYNLSESKVVERRMRLASNPRCRWIDKPMDCTDADIEIVISRYSEDLTWLSQAPFSCYRHRIYNKGPTDVTCPVEDNCTISELPNIGREGHTWLSHIIQNYDDLPLVSVFLPGSASDMHKFSASKCLLGQVMFTENSVFRGVWSDSILEEFRDFHIESYASTNAQNLKANPESTLTPEPDRPFGVWYEKNFPADLPPIHSISYGGYFAVSREHIKQRSVDYYENLLSYFTRDGTSSPEVGHYFERAWGAIFYPYPQSCTMTYKEDFRIRLGAL